MGNLSQRNRRVFNDHYGMVPRNDVPRATFRRPHEFKLTCPSGYLIPILCDEVLPGDVHKGRAVIFARLADLIFPLMDNVTIETQFFFFPMRLGWENARKFWGEQDSPSDSISYVIPTVPVTSAYASVGSIYDYFGIPGEAQLGATKNINAIPLRGYNIIFNEWYRDQNLVPPAVTNTDDGPDLVTDYVLKRRAKKHDYFTSALPFPQKGYTNVSLPLGTQAPVIGIGKVNDQFSAGPLTVYESTGSTASYAAYRLIGDPDGANDSKFAVKGTATPAGVPAIYADLSQATAATINQLRLAVQTQKLLETDARSGTRYTEQLRARWGVTPQDSRLQRPEYIGGGVTSIQTTAIAQTSETSGSSPLGSLAGQATAGGEHRFTCIGYEHGYIIGLLSIMTKPSYQQGIHRMWTRSTRYDFATPEFMGLGEQAIRNDEIYATGFAADTNTFGYQERYGEYRFSYNRVAGLFRSQVTGNIDEWHLAQQFGTLPTLGEEFIQENAPFGRIFAAGDTALPQTALVDILFDIRSTRPLPAFGVPGGLKGTF